MSANLTVENRDIDKNPRQIRAMGYTPLSIYGKGVEARNGQVNTHEFEMAYKNNKEGEWKINFNSEELNAKIQELQINHATNEILNIEFQIV